VAVALPDAVIVWFGTGEMRVLASEAGAGGPFGALAIADFDADGSLDVGVTREGAGAVDVFSGDGHGGFFPP
jgi:hypothetical protein